MIAEKGRENEGGTEIVKPNLTYQLNRAKKCPFTCQQNNTIITVYLEKKIDRARRVLCFFNAAPALIERGQHLMFEEREPPDTLSG